MNWLLIITIILLAWNIVRGYSTGILRMLFSIVAWICIIVIVSWSTPYVSSYIEEHTSIQTEIKEKSHERMRELVEENGHKSEMINKDTDPNSQLLESLGIKLPSVVTDKLFDTNDLADTILETTGIYEVISNKISKLAVTGISFVLVLIITMILFHLLLQVVKFVEKMPVINGMNRVLGAAGGLIKGIVLIWIIFAIIALNGTSSIGIAAVSYIYESTFLQILYENNVVLIILLAFL